MTGPGSATEGLTVFYRGRFQPLNVRSPSDYVRIDAEGVFLRAYGYDLWFPVFLESGQTSREVSFPRVVLRTPSDFHAVILGSKVEEYEEGRDRVSEWKAGKVDLMHVQCTAQRFEVTSRGTVHAYHYPTEDSRAAADRILAFTDSLTRESRHFYGLASPDGQTYLMEMPPYGMIASQNVSALPTELW